jgi:chorismate-pyruvate lyase
MNPVITASRPDEPIVRDPSLSLFQKVLLTTDGTVTQLLELYIGQPVRVNKLSHGILRGAAPDFLLAADNDELLQRSILLCTGEAKAPRNLLYAESLFVIARLPAIMQRQLLESDRPIGLLWREQRLETYREIVACGREPCGLLAPHFDLGENTLMLVRSYLVYHQHKPLGVITEKFPASYFLD